MSSAPDSGHATLIKSLDLPAKVALLTAPYYSSHETADGSRPSEDDPARVDRFNQLLRDAAARHPDTVTVVADYNPLENPAGGPNFDRFGSDVLYRINIDNNGDAVPDITYDFRFTDQVRDANTFLYATGPITSGSSCPRCQGPMRRACAPAPRPRRDARHARSPRPEPGPQETPQHGANHC